ncbi:nitroreductase family deazaflavin-dependent oxidoreductase [Micromonospora ureilytica]|uniref:nitroreductase family deazaflavin-dependent oxidoreductase n=1 Tax=Micromonospora ureilytica TaxID=709868 RepID=UPI002E1479C6|nr:nitroreductase family deazaflavin-dependent oxidoreductase [Micromonospora ureilytica]
MRQLAAPTPPSGLGRLLFRLPILLYRAHLGRLLGRRFVLIEHVGRRTGQLRHTVVEVIEASPEGHVVAAGFGARSDWYRNLRAHPRADIQLGGQRRAVTAVPLPAAAGAELMARYAQRHPFAARRLCRLMGYEVDGSTADYRAVGARIPFLRLTPA